MFDAIATSAGKAPSLVEWFQNWSTTPTSGDSPYRGDLVQTAWSRKALPVITWMSGDGDGSASDPYLCRLDDVVTGKWDSYLLSFAGSILATNLPVVIRFDHEMNGNWYDWSGGRVRTLRATIRAIRA